MKASARRISLTLAVTGALFIAVATLYGVGAYCTQSSAGCMASAISFGIPAASEFSLTIDNTARSTAVAAVHYPSTIEMGFGLLSSVGVYLVFLGVMALLVLEVFELYYIRQLLGKKRRA